MSEIKRKTFTPKMRTEISLKTNNRCCYCGDPLKKGFHIAHMVSFLQLKSQGIKDDNPDNYMASCPQCNRFERGAGLEFFREAIMDQTKTAMRDSVNYRFALKHKQIIETPTPCCFLF